jgi:hypothetical protein
VNGVIDVSQNQGKTARCYACGNEYDPTTISEHARRTFVETCQPCIFLEIDSKYEDTTIDFRG